MFTVVVLNAFEIDIGNYLYRSQSKSTLQVVFNAYYFYEQIFSYYVTRGL